MYFTDMYMNIMKKYGKKSPQLEKYKMYYHMYREKPHVVERIYHNIMKEEVNKCSD